MRVQNWSGKRVVLTKGHPWATHSGTVGKLVNTPVVGMMWEVALDNGMDVLSKEDKMKLSE